MALGMEKAGLHHLLLNDFDKYATQTLKKNRPQWNVMHGDVGKIYFTPYKGKVDLLTGGFPCQTFSYAGKKWVWKIPEGHFFMSLPEHLKSLNLKSF